MGTSFETSLETGRVPPHESSVSAAIAAIVLGICGPIIFVLVPFFVAMVKSGRAFSASEVSLISSADMLGMFIASVYAATWIRRQAWRPHAFVALFLLAGANGAGNFAHAFLLFGFTRIVAGFGGGTLMAIGLAAMGDRQRSDAWFGWFVAAQAILGSIGAWAVPRFIEPYGLPGLFGALVLLYLAVVPLVAVMPGRGAAPVRQDAVDHAEGSLVSALLALAGAFMFSMGIFAIWSHIELIGEQAGLNAIATGNAISSAYLLGIAASVIAAMLAGKAHRGWFFAIILLSQVAALALLLGRTTELSFAIATLLLGWAWYFSTPFQLGVIVAVDRTGRFVVLFISAIKSSYVASGLVLSVLLSGNASLDRITIFSGICAIASFVIFFILALRAPGITRKTASCTPATAL